VPYLRKVGGVLRQARVILSTDDGATWTGGTTTFDHDDWVTCMPVDDGSFALVTCANPDNWGVRKSTYAAPLTFTDQLSLMDYSHEDDNLPAPSNQAFAFGGQGVAMAWTVENLSGGLDTLFFDAEWRRGPGYPNLEPGFPLALPYDVVSPPAVCELDGDATSELVFGDLHGWVRAYNHDGTVVPGWPQRADSLVRDETIAVGDLQVDGASEVVVGSATGKVFVFRSNGTLMPGWPLDLGTGVPAYVSIGRILDGGQRQIVATSANQLHLLGYDATEAAGFPVTLSSTVGGPAAIGDLDGDAYNDIVVTCVAGVDVYSAYGMLEARRSPAGHTFGKPPTLADLDLDGEIEIAMPSSQSDIYVLRYDGTDYPGWPITMTSGNPGSSVAMAQIRGLPEPQLMWTEISALQSKVQAFNANGTTLSGFPKLTGADWYVYAEPIADVLRKSIMSDIVVGSRDTYAYGWTATGLDLPEWPKALGGRCEVSAASGDFDQDGRVEVAFCTVSPPKLTILDMGTNVYRNPGHIAGRDGWWWPMYQYNPERQGCLACGVDRVLSVPGGGAKIARVQFAAPRPNPGSRIAFAFELPARAAVQLVVHDVAGRAVRRLVKSELEAGAHTYTWDGAADGGEPLPAGIYYAALRVAGAPAVEVLTRKAVLIR
jgi:hypothetical protein